MYDLNDSDTSIFKYKNFVKQEPVAVDYLQVTPPN